METLLRLNMAISLPPNDAAFYLAPALLSFQTHKLVVSLYFADDHRLHLVDRFIQIRPLRRFAKIFFFHMKSNLSEKELPGTMMFCKLSEFNPRQLTLFLRFKDAFELPQPLCKIGVNRIRVFNLGCLNGGAHGQKLIPVVYQLFFRNNSDCGGEYKKTPHCGAIT